jgi:hypothetical protein
MKTFCNICPIEIKRKLSSPWIKCRDHRRKWGKGHVRQMNPHTHTHTILFLLKNSFLLATELKRYK